jgi:N6-adenosine-specific RNA methylase IME4
VPGPYLELFARRPIAGWTTWGNEIATADRRCPTDGASTMAVHKQTSEQ